LGLAFEYNTDLFEAETIERMARNFQVLLSAAVEDPNRRIEDLPVLTREEREQVLMEFNAGAAQPVRDIGIHQLFEEQVARTPERIAVVCGPSACHTQNSIFGRTAWPIIYESEVRGRKVRLESVWNDRPTCW